MAFKKLEITGTFPEDGQVLYRNGIIKVVFNNYLDVTTLVVDNFRLIDMSTYEIIPTRLSYIKVQNAVLIQSTDYLQPLKQYSLIIVGSKEDICNPPIRDTSGQSLLFRYILHFTTSADLDLEIPNVADVPGQMQPDWFKYDISIGVGKMVMDQTGQSVVQFTTEVAGFGPNGEYIPHPDGSVHYVRPFEEEPIPYNEDSGCLHVEQTYPISIVEEEDYTSYNIDPYLNNDYPVNPSGITIIFAASGSTGDILLRHTTPMGHIYSSGFTPDDETYLEYPNGSGYTPEESGYSYEFYYDFLDILKEKITITNEDVLGMNRPSDKLAFNIWFNSDTNKYGETVWVLSIYPDPDTQVHGKIVDNKYIPWQLDSGHLNYNNKYTVSIDPLDGWGSQNCKAVTEYSFSFITTLIPMYCSVQAVRADLGDIADSFSDAEIAILIHRVSLEVIELYKLNKENPAWNPYDLSVAAPPGVSSYVCCAVELMLVLKLLGKYAAGAGITKTLGNASISRNSTGPLPLLSSLRNELQDCKLSSLNEINATGTAVTAVKAEFARNRPSTPWTFTRTDKNFEEQSPSGKMHYYRKYGDAGPWEDENYDQYVRPRRFRRF